MKRTLQIFFAVLTTFGFAQGSQDFETQTSLTNSYADGSFTEDGIAYTYVHCRDAGFGTATDFSITGKGLLLRRISDNSHLEWTIPNGIGTLTFDARKAFTGGENNRQLEVLVNGTSVWTSPTFGADNIDNTVHNFSVTIQKEGNTTIRIKIGGTATSNRQVSIDNIVWTEYLASYCSPITALNTSNITSTSLDLTWTEGATETSWNVEYGTAGFTQGTGTTVNVTTTPTTTITGLIANTSYDVYVQADCGNGSLSSWEMINFTTDSDFSNDTFDLFGFSYYPNPVNDVLTLSSNSPIQNVSVSNILGQQIKVSSSSENTSLDLSDLPTGNYLVKVTIDGISKTFKVVKR